MARNRSRFGNLVKAYDVARPSYPKKIISTVRKEIDAQHPLILDLGCGTGISTRQLAGKGTVVIGSDIDSGMLDAAIAHTTPNVAYVQAPADKLPFASKTFDAVTAFQAFHWFNDLVSLREIKRVLKPKGILCIVSPEHGFFWGETIRNITREYAKKKVTPKYSKNNFQHTLHTGGFKIKKMFSFRRVTLYTLAKYLVLLQSHSIWNQVPKAKRPLVFRALKKHFSSQLQNGHIRDAEKIEVIIATAL